MIQIFYPEIPLHEIKEHVVKFYRVSDSLKFGLLTVTYQNAHS